MPITKTKQQFGLQSALYNMYFVPSDLFINVAQS